MIIDYALAYAIATEIMLSDDIEPCFVNPVGYMWVFVRKRNEKNKIVHYKACLVAHSFSQRPRIDYNETYSPIMDVITFRYLITLVVFEKWSMQLMDVVTAYLYGDLDMEIYMKVPERLTLTGSNISKPRNTLAIRLGRFKRMWYNCLSEYLTSQEYVNNELCPCVFIKKSHSGFAIVVVYVNDMNLIGTSEELERTAVHMKSKFEMKDLENTRYYLSLKIKHLLDGILVHQSNYT
ncbi:hypothetical protein ACFX2F_008810 [Malus domestica]